MRWLQIHFTGIEYSHEKLERVASNTVAKAVCWNRFPKRQWNLQTIFLLCATSPPTSVFLKLDLKRSFSYATVYLLRAWILGPALANSDPPVDTLWVRFNHRRRIMEKQWPTNIIMLRAFSINSLGKATHPDRATVRLKGYRLNDAFDQFHDITFVELKFRSFRGVSSNSIIWNPC